jgi:hypothetical protein
MMFLCKWLSYRYYQIRAAEDDTLLVANGTSCRHQIRDGASKNAVHLAQVLYANLKVKEEI